MTGSQLEKLTLNVNGMGYIDSSLRSCAVKCCDRHRTAGDQTRRNINELAAGCRESASVIL